MKCNELVYDIIMNVCGLDASDDIEFEIISLNLEQSTLQGIEEMLLSHINNGLSIIDAAVKTREEVREKLNMTAQDSATGLVD